MQAQVILVLPQHFICCNVLPTQRVQRELSTTERADKADDSPVTVADYGE
jgi:hypothetical protein